MSGRFVPLKPRIGAKVSMSGRELLDPGFAAECMEALEHYGVLVFPRADLDDDQQVAFSRNLGDIVPQGPLREDGSPEFIYKITLDPQENPSGAEYLKSTIHFHIDGLLNDAPPTRATMLSARRLTATGGQTEFCNMYAAYDDLTKAEKRRCESLRARHSLAAANRVFNPEATEEERTRWRRGSAPKEHPLVWRHESGRKSLILGVTSDALVGLPEDESRALIEMLTDHTTRPELAYRHEWEIGDLLIWDNCGVMHRATPYDPSAGRLMHRTVLYGNESIH